MIFGSYKVTREQNRTITHSGIRLESRGSNHANNAESHVIIDFLDVVLRLLIKFVLLLK